jgi:hypothetical protein
VKREDEEEEEVMRMEMR